MKQTLIDCNVTAIYHKSSFILVSVAQDFPNHAKNLDWTEAAKCEDVSFKAKRKKRKI